MRDFRKYEVWKLGMEVTSDIYKISKSFPKTEAFALTSQIRRSAVSIPSNIAEGCSRKTEKAFKQFIEIALGSAFELETQVLIAKNVNYIEEAIAAGILKKINHLKASLNSLRNKLKANS